MQNHLAQDDLRGVRWDTTSAEIISSLQPLKWAIKTLNRQQMRSVRFISCSQSTTRGKVLLTSTQRLQQGLDADFKEAWVLLAGHGCSSPALPCGCAFPPAAAEAEAAAELGPACCHPSVTHTMLCWRDPEKTHHQHGFPPSSCVLCSAINPFVQPPPHCLSLQSCRVGGNTSFPLNNCVEAESAGSNPLSAAQLIITVCLNLQPDDDDDDDTF